MTEYKKNILLTGATSGIGLAAALALCQKGHRVLALGSRAATCERAYEIIRAACPEGDIQYLSCDLSSLGEIKKCAEEIKTILHGQALDVLAHNAGIFTRWYQTGPEGIELQFMVNYLAGFTLSLLLKNELQKSDDPRIITTTSGSHKFARLNKKDMQHARRYHCLWAYKCTKMQNVLYSYEWNRHMEKETGIHAFAADPGLVNTPMGSRHTNGLTAWFWEKRRKKGVSPSKGAETLVYLACAPLARENRQVYYRNCRPHSHDTYCRREDAAAVLWEYSEKLCPLD